MENKNIKTSLPPLVFTVNIPAVIASFDSGDYVARVVKEKQNILIVPYTIDAIKNATVRNQKEKRLAEVQLTFSQKSQPAKLSFKWVSKK
jgi:hypothetical protein